jgi:nucleoside-diphosphate-sugar epimerase
MQKRILIIGATGMLGEPITRHLKKEENSGSPLGLRLASALKEFGLVNHSIWIEMHKDSGF